MLEADITLQVLMSFRYLHRYFLGWKQYKTMGSSPLSSNMTWDTTVSASDAHPGAQQGKRPQGHFEEMRFGKSRNYRLLKTYSM